MFIYLSISFDQSIYLFIQIFRTLILDEVHERSVESDVLLICVRELLRHSKQLNSKGIRLILMSATADVNRYRKFFEEGGGGGMRVKTFAMSLPPTHFGSKSYFLDGSMGAFLEELEEKRKEKHRVKGGESVEETEGVKKDIQAFTSLFSHQERLFSMYLNSSSSLHSSSPPSLSSLLKSFASSSSTPLAPLMPPQPPFFSDSYNQLVVQLIQLIHQSDGDVSHKILVFLPTLRAISSLMVELRRDLQVRRREGGRGAKGREGRGKR